MGAPTAAGGDEQSTRRPLVLAVVGVVLMAAGIVVAALPKDWIEESFSVDPDAGSGFVELLIALVPIVVGALLMGLAYLDRRQSVRRAARP
jgi:uncharacterized membrane protein HdeD (DUF308 family)